MKPLTAKNRRNGYSKKTALTETAKIDVRNPRDREGTFDPKLIQRYQRRFPGFDDKIVSMYARGMSVREIQGYLAELYGIDVSPDLISTVTDAVLETVAEWQNRPLEASYPLVFFDALRVKIRDEGLVNRRRQPRRPPPGLVRHHEGQQWPLCLRAQRLIRARFRAAR